jgi:hypothetical protein
MPEHGEEEKEHLDLPHSLRRLGECTFYDVMCQCLLTITLGCHCYATW